MADYIVFETEAEHIEHDDEVSEFSDNVSGNSFIDNQDVNADVNFYRGFTTVENDIEQVLREWL